jgi:Tfp pilus assembly protein PilX
MYRSHSADEPGVKPAWSARMQHSGKHGSKCGNEKGTVLMVVLISLLITIVLGIVLIKSSVVESRIAGNDLKSQKDFYSCETAGEIAKAKLEDILYTVNLDENTRTTDISSIVNGSGQVSGAKVTVSFLKSASPHEDSGNGRTSTFVNYYVIESTVNGRTIKKGVWKSFPKIEE